MIHRANADFWKDFRRLPADIRERAGKQFAVLKANSRYPSLHLKKWASVIDRKAAQKADDAGVQNRHRRDGSWYAI